MNKRLAQAGEELRVRDVRLEERNAVVDRLENANRDLEVRNAKLEAERRGAEERSQREEGSTEMLRDKVDLLEKTQEEMKGEIEVLITQCKQLQATVKVREAQISKQAETLEQLDVALQQKDAEVQKRENYFGKMVRQLEEKKNQLHDSQLKIRQLNKSLAADVTAKLAEKDKELKVMKEMIRGHHAEMQAKTKDVLRMKRLLSKMKKANELRTRFITTFADRKNEEQQKQLEKMEQLDIAEAQDENEDAELEPEPSAEEAEPETEEKDAEEPEEPNKRGLLPQITPRGKKMREKSDVSASFHERYMKRFDDYLSGLGDAGFGNNSSKVKSLLSQNYESLAQEGEAGSQEQPVRSPQGAKKSPPEVAADVGEIIKKSLGKPAAIAASVGTVKRKAVNIRVGNDPIGLISPPIQRKGHKNSQT